MSWIPKSKPERAKADIYPIIHEFIKQYKLKGKKKGEYDAAEEPDSDDSTW